MTQTITRVFENIKGGATIKVCADMGFGKESSGYYIEDYSNKVFEIIERLDQDDKEEISFVEKIANKFGTVWSTDYQNSNGFDETYFTTKQDAIDFALGQYC